MHNHKWIKPLTTIVFCLFLWLIFSSSVVLGFDYWAFNGFGAANNSEIVAMAWEILYSSFVGACVSCASICYLSWMEGV